MSKQALPCIVCGAALNNVTDDSENQPHAGTAFMSHGHYGSTAFDPFDGTYLEVNICDPCLIQAQLNSEVLWGRDHRPVIAEGMVVAIWEILVVECGITPITLSLSASPSGAIRRYLLAAASIFSSQSPIAKQLGDSTWKFE